MHLNPLPSEAKPHKTHFESASPSLKNSSLVGIAFYQSQGHEKSENETLLEEPPCQVVSREIEKFRVQGLGFRVLLAFEGWAMDIC